RQLQERLPERPRWRRFAPLLTLLALLIVWQMVAALEIYPSFIIPPPMAVLQKWIAVAADGRLWLHTSTTLVEMTAGLALGLTTGLAAGYVIAKSSLLEDLFSPLIVAFQSTPVVAYAPLLVIWFGNGATSKVITCALIVFFPMLVNTIVGIRNVPPSL